MIGLDHLCSDLLAMLLPIFLKNCHLFPSLPLELHGGHHVQLENQDQILSKEDEILNKLNALASKIDKLEENKM